MPKHPKFIHPLRTLRSLLPVGYRTQEEFAELVGVSAVAIRKIESGKLPLSEKMGHRIMLSTGVAPKSLVLGNDLRSFYDQSPYTKETFLNNNNIRKTRATAFENAYLQHRVGNEMFFELSALLEASWYNDLFYHVIYLFSEWLFEILKELDLSDAFQNVGEKHGVPGWVLLDLFFQSKGWPKGKKKRFPQHPPTVTTSPDIAHSGGSWFATKSQSPFGEWLRLDNHPSSAHWKEHANNFLAAHPELQDPDLGVVPEDFAKLHPNLVVRSAIPHQSPKPNASHLPPFRGFSDEIKTLKQSAKTSSPRKASPTRGKRKK